VGQRGVVDAPIQLGARPLPCRPGQIARMVGQREQGRLIDRLRAEDSHYGLLLGEGPIVVDPARIATAAGSGDFLGW